MLEVTPDDIARLRDDDLRTLVGLLCEAELGRKGLPRSAVTWGGSQDAGDGGIDVRVDLPINTILDDFVPRPKTGFQVKKPDMPPAAIKDEMAPKNIFRASLAELAQLNGAYVIVSSAASLTDSTLKNRRKALTAVVKTYVKDGSLHTDFYDRSRVATWVRAYPGIMAWVREKSGRPMNGWHPYGSWTRGGESGEYLFDETPRVRVAGSRSDKAATAQQAIATIRSLLSNPRSVLRLVGLSGVGKTRLAEALFDQRLSTEVLPTSYVLYTDTALSPTPAPTHIAESLVDDRQRAILVVDNCPSALHSKLSEIALRPESSISVLTIEYDIREDLPEGTDVFEMLPASEDLTSNLLRARFPHLSPVDLRRLSEHSGGNARVALVIAAALGKNRSTAGLSDDDLFQRLFWQRNTYDPILERAARVCALVYSLDGETLDGAESELSILAGLAEISAGQMFSQLASLSHLVQKRGPWRAILPHAIANTLARQALKLFPKKVLLDRLIGDKPGRLARSFCHRLSFLHECPEAVAIVEAWLRLGELLVTQDETQLAMFVNTAPVAPELWLTAMERLVESNEAFFLGQSRVLDTIRLIAFEAQLFSRAANLLVQVILSEASTSRMEVRTYLSSLFRLYLSGTHATAAQRISIIADLLRAADPDRQNLGVLLIGVYLEAGHGSTHFPSDFGTRKRDYGYQPTTWDEVQQWFTCAIDLLAQMASSDSMGARLRALLAEKFGRLWMCGNCYETLEKACLSLHKTSFWPEGLSAIRKTLYYEGEEMRPELKQRLQDLAEQLEPVGFADRIRGVLFGGSRAWDQLGEGNGVDLNAEALRLGEQAAQDAQVLSELLPEVVSHPGTWHFGAGLASSASSLEGLWRQLVHHLLQTPKQNRRPQVLAGFLSGYSKIHPESSAKILDEALVDPALGPFFLELQTAVPICQRGIERVLQAIEHRLVPLDSYRQLHWWDKNTGGLSHSDRAKIVLKLADTQSGVEAALGLLCWAFKRLAEAKLAAEPLLVEAGRHILGNLKPEDIGDSIGYDLKIVADNCLEGAETELIARHLCRSIRGAMVNTKLIFHNVAEPLISVAGLHPLALLDELLLGPVQDFQWTYHGFRNLYGPPICFDRIPELSILEWADKEPDERLKRLAKVATMFNRPTNDSALQWTPLALAMLERAPQKETLLATYARLLVPMSWSGSRADLMESRLVLFDDLVVLNRSFTDSVLAEKTRFQCEIEREREAEREEQRQYELFE